MVRAETWDSWKGTGASDPKGPMRAQEKSKKTSSQTSRKAGPKKKKQKKHGKPIGVLEAGEL